ncbi:MAG: hypothetical protein ACXVB9_03395 [Bdellovibrionota bacterium]
MKALALLAALASLPAAHAETCGGTVKLNQTYRNLTPYCKSGAQYLALPDDSDNGTLPGQWIVEWVNRNPQMHLTYEVCGDKVYAYEPVSQYAYKCDRKSDDVIVHEFDLL